MKRERGAKEKAKKREGDKKEENGSGKDGETSEAHQFTFLVTPLPECGG